MSNNRQPSNANLTLSILQSDLSRTQYLVRSLLRQRLAKISRHALHYLELTNSQKEDRSPSLTLSQSEFTFLAQSQTLLHTYYSSSFLSMLPQNLQRLDDNSGGVNMIEGPDLKGAVFVRCLAERWRSSDVVHQSRSTWLDGPWQRRGESPNGLEDSAQELDDPDREFEMQRNQIWVVRWEDVRKGVLGGSLELL